MIGTTMTIITTATLPTATRKDQTAAQPACSGVPLGTTMTSASVSLRDKGTNHTMSTSATDFGALARLNPGVLGAEMLEYYGTGGLF